MIGNFVAIPSPGGWSFEIRADARWTAGARDIACIPFARRIGEIFSLLVVVSIAMVAVSSAMIDAGIATMLQTHA